MPPAYAQAIPLQVSIPLDTGWSALLLDFTFILPIVIMIIIFWPMIRQVRTQFRFVRRQEQYLDHQTAASDRILSQNDAINRSIEEQYARTNADNERALANSAQALQLQADILAELRAMNAALARLASPAR